MQTPSARLGRSSVRSLTNQAIGACISGILLFSAQPVWAQDRSSDPDLEALIPDSALDNPEAWAGGQPADQAAEAAKPEVRVDLDAPLLNGEQFALPWPDDDADIPAFADLEPEPDVAQTMAEAIDLPDRPRGQQRQREEERISSRVVLVFPAETTAMPGRDAFIQRYRELSAIEQYGKDETNLAQIAARAKSDRELLLRLLEIDGYYDGDVRQSIDGAEGSQAEGPAVNVKDARIRFDIRPGDRYRFGEVTLPGLELAGRDYATFRDIYGLKKGDPADSDDIVAARGMLDIAMGDSGYPFVKMGEPELLIDHDREEGDLMQPVTPGGKYNFGTVVSDQPKFLSGKHLQMISRFDPGDVYKRSEVDDLRRAILATGLVSAVSVTPRETKAPANGEAGEIALDVGLTQAPLHTIAGALGYDSKDGFRVEASWEHRNFFPPEGKIQFRGILGTREQLAGTTFRKNNFRGRDQILTLDLYASTVDRSAYNARTVAMTASFEKITTLLFQKPWTWSVGAEILATNEREGDVDNITTPRSTYYIAALPLRLSYDGSDSLLNPMRGFRASLRASPEISYQRGGEKHFYTRIQADASYYQPVTEKVVIASRVRLGSIPGTNIENIAPSRRFYAGGGGSVRGYGYQQIGPRDTVGDPSGGRSLTEFSLEARVKTGMFGGALSVVPFIDAGAVDTESTPRFRNIRYGAGLGIRYDTGFGPMRVDVGTPLNPEPGDSRIAVYVSLGQAF